MRDTKKIVYKSYIFSFIHQKHFYENQKFNFPAQNIRDTEKMLENKIV